MKERLVGAAVLMAAAVILIPEMLSGPRRAPARPAPAAVNTAQPGDANLKRYSIDLTGTQPPAAVPQTPTVIEEPVPPGAVPQDDVPPASEDAAAPVTEPLPAPDTSLEATPDQSSAAPSVQALQPAPLAQVEPSPPISTPPAPAASAPPSVATRRWAVQIMATPSREDAQREAEDLRNGNYAAFVMPVQSGASTLYRVRVGPFAERALAEEALRKLKSVRSNSIVVAQP